MYKNVGNVIKGYASLVTGVGIITSIVIGMVIMSFEEEAILIGLVIAIVGSFSSYLGSMLLAGFGELVNNSTIIAKQYSDDTFETEDENDELPYFIAKINENLYGKSISSNSDPIAPNFEESIPDSSDIKEEIKKDEQEKSEDWVKHNKSQKKNNDKATGSDIIFCTNCGTKSSKDSKFCPNCGTSLN